jgi:acetylornithine deacetylase/succinyl-diaminopimelate desuccinylase-like protein
MTEPRSAALRYADENYSNFLEGLKDLCTIPSISANPHSTADMQKAAEWVENRLTRLGASGVKIYPTAGHPLVYGEFMEAGPGAPTILVYGHYDVQPPEPLELWVSEPFNPTQRDDSLFARGASDMKGQVAAVLNAVEAVKSAGSLPVNLKFLIEGEEEIGSPSLPEFMKQHKELLASDFALNPDTGMLAADTPSITYALRGMAYFELRVYGPDHDLHSGGFGGVVLNPAKALCDLISGMHDARGRVTLPGFYNRVRELDQKERQELARLPLTEDVYLKLSGAPALWGEEGFTPVERNGARPTLEVNGLLSGYTGAGAKTVLPAHAMAKISMRLVPDQDPEEVHQQLQEYLEQNAPQAVRWELLSLVGGPASISRIDSPAVQALADAQEAVWGVRPVFKREGGSVPVVAQFQEILGIESVNTGFGLSEDNAHSPNEKLDLPTWKRGIDALIHYFYNLAKS